MGKRLLPAQQPTDYRPTELSSLSVRRLLPAIALAVIFWLVPAAPALDAQSLALLDVDPSGFPRIEGSVLLYDADGNAVQPLGLADLKITENGLPRTVTSVFCPDPTPPEGLSVVLVIDRSGSMVTPLPGNLLPIDLVRTGVDAFLQSLDFSSPTAVALTAFNDRSFLLSDFRTTSQPLRDALGGLVAEGGTRYDPPFLDPFSGAIELLKRRPDTVRRIILFITDGEPEIPPSSGTIIDRAREIGAEVWAITIGSRMTSQLRTISERTGGEAWGSVQDAATLSGILRRVALITRGVAPCRIEWISDVDCGPGPVWRDVVATHAPTGLKALNSYRVPDNDLVTLEVSSKILYFGQTRFPNISQLSITITARNGDFTVSGAEFSDSEHFRIESWGGTNPPFTLAEGESRTVQVRFIPRDSTTYAGTLRFQGLPCDSREVFVAGGERAPTAEREPLTLQSPLGGEAFNACDSVSITWGGVPPERAIRVQFSSDDGRSWHTISDSATGYELRWLPPAPGENYRIRISTDAPEQHIISTFAGGGTLDEDTIFATDAVLGYPMGIDVDDRFVYVADNGSHRVRAIDLQTGIITTLAGNGTLGNGGDGAPGPLARLNSPTDIYVQGDTAFITEYPRVRAIDLRTGIIESWAGNIYRDYSPDGTHMANLGSLMIPFSVVADDRYIYVSELDSHRIRKIDRTTRIISTVAGGGGTGGFDSDGRPATEAYLLLPRGLALKDSLLYVAEEVGHRVRVINLRTGIIRTVAGNGTIGDDGDGGPARNARLNGPVDLALWGDTLLIADRYANRIRMVNLRTGIIRGFAGTGGAGAFGGDGGPARNARFDSPMGLTRRGDLLFVSDRLNNRVRQITLYRADGLDSTRSTFRVSAPRGVFTQSPVSFGNVPQGERRDTVLTSFYCNTGDVPMAIDSARVIGPHAADFAITGGLSDVPIQPNECRTLAVAFTPGGGGQREARILIYSSCSLPDTLLLSGTSGAPCAITFTDVAEVEPVVFGIAGIDSRDTLLPDVLCNNGGTPLSGTLRLVSPDGAWTLLSAPGFTIPSGACLDVAVRFNPDVPGQSMASLEYVLDGACGAGPTLISGRALRPGRLDGGSIDLGRFACADEGIDTAFLLSNRGELPVVIDGIILIENSEGFSLTGPLPDPSDPLIIPPGEERTIPVRLLPTSSGRKNGRIRIISDDPAGDLELDVTAEIDSIRVASLEGTVAMQRDAGRPFPRDTVIRFVNTGDRPVTLTGVGFGGDDPDFFDVDPGIFPAVINPGDTVSITVTFLEPFEDRPYRGLLQPIADLPCANPVGEIVLILGGSAPLLRATDLRLGPINCDRPEWIDTTLTLHNDGGGELVIDRIELLDDPEGTLEVNASIPITIPPGESRNISVRYRPTTPGTTAARLLLHANTLTSPEEISIDGRRNRVSFSVDRSSLLFRNGKREETLTLVNTGDLPITWDLDDLTGPFEIVSIVPQTAAPGESSSVVIRFVGVDGVSAEGVLMVREDVCGEATVVMLFTENSPATVRLTLPIDSVMVNEVIDIPVRYELLSGIEPGPEDSLIVEVSFIGTTFFFESLNGGEIVGRTWDRLTETLTLSVAVRFGDRRGDTLLSLRGRGLQGRFPATPLTFGEIAWSRPEVSVETVDGHLLVLGLCLEEGLGISVRQPLVRSILPHPARSRTRLRLELPDWTSMTIRLIDGEGISGTVYRSEYLEAGMHDVELDLGGIPSGAYTLLIETPHGSTTTPIILLRE